MDDFQSNHYPQLSKKQQRDGPNHSLSLCVAGICRCVFLAGKHHIFKAHFNLFFQLKQFTLIFLHLDE